MSLNELFLAIFAYTPTLTSLECYCLTIAKPLHEFSKSSFYVARYQYMLPDGDLSLAQEYLERVAVGNTEESPQAVEMLKLVRAAKDARDLLNF
jgi:hypothetical protein